MNKYILTLLIIATFAKAGEGQGTAGVPTGSYSNTDDEVDSQLVCKWVPEPDSFQQDSSSVRCVCISIDIYLDRYHNE